MGCIPDSLHLAGSQTIFDFPEQCSLHTGKQDNGIRHH